MKLKIVCLSDTHGLYRGLKVPGGDILVHAGDFTRNGTLRELNRFNSFLGLLPHQYKIVVAGNHDFCCEEQPEVSRRILTNCIYLQDREVIIEGIKFYGTPWQPWFNDFAFNLQRGREIRQKWDLIPGDTDVLITHGPPVRQGDRNIQGQQVGCTDLMKKIRTIRPRLHIFGHIHEDAGITSNRHTTFINASICNFLYQPVNSPIVYEYDLEGC